MAGPIQSWMYLRDRSGLAFEVINGARTAAYLANPALAIPGISSCAPLTGLGCATYPYRPYLGPEIPGYFTYPNVSGNYLSVPDAAAQDIVGDITIVAKVQPTAWTGTTQTIVGKWSTASNLSYLFQINTTGGLIFSWTIDGLTVLTASSTVPIPGTVANVAMWVAVTFDVNNGAAGRTARFWKSTDGNNWTLIGTAVTTATATSIFNGTSPVFIGTQTAITGRFVGVIHSVSVRNGIGTAGVVGGTEVLKVSGHDITNAAATTFTATSGQTVTVVKAATPLVLTARVDCATMQALAFSTPTADPAPWYNVNYPASADALGFVVEDWTGLDDGHVSRSTTPWGGYGGGASLGQIASNGRTMKVNLYLFGRSEQAVEYLFRWLGALLTGVCASCATDSLMIRRFCGSTVNLWDGVAEMRNVGLVEGLKWESEFVPEGNCYIRRASFALMAGDPCLYSPETAVSPDGTDATPANLSACFAVSVPNPLRANCRPECSEVKAACRLTRAFTVNPMAAMAPIVTWTNASTSQYTFPFRAVAYADPALVGPSNPCGLPILGELYVRPLPPGSALRWDVVGRQVQYMDETTGGWASGWAYIDPNDPPEQRFFALPCGKGYIVMEPSSLCATFVTGTTWTLDGITYVTPSYPSISVSLGERMSCA